MSEDILDAPMEHIEIESLTGKFRREAIQAAQKRAEAEALANKRRHIRIADDCLKARYMPGEKPGKFNLFSKWKACVVMDASISGIGLEGPGGLKKDDKVTLIISDGDRAEIPEFTITATVMFAVDVDKKISRYGVHYDQVPTPAYSEVINRETLKEKLAKAGN